MSTTAIESGTADRAKWADTDPSVLEVIRARWSPRAFSNRPVADRDLKLVLEAARWAASSYNEQPWRFFIARNGDAHFQSFVQLLMPANQAWAAHAPVLIFIAYKKTFSHNGTPNHYGLHDAGQAFAQLSLQATALGLHTHGMAGFDHDRARTELGLPEDYAFGAAVALGHVGDPSVLPEQFKAMELAPRTRKPLASLVFAGGWNQQFTL